MKNLTVKKYLILALYLVALLGIVIGTHYVLVSTKEKTYKKYEVKKYEAVLGGAKVASLKDIELTSAEAKTILEAKIAYDSNNKEIARIYDTLGINDFGSIAILIAVDTEYKILGVTHTVIQSYSPVETGKYIDAYVGKLIHEPLDGVTAPSVTFSIATVEDLIKAVSIKHGAPVKEEPNDYVKLFGEDYELGEAIDINDESIIKMHEVLVEEEVVAHTYFIVKEGEYDSYNQKSASIEMQVIIDKDTTKILGTHYDMDNYKHTHSYKKYLDSYFTKLIAANTYAANYKSTSIEIDGESGATASGGTSNTVLLAMSMLTELQVYLSGTVTIGDVEVITDDYVNTKQVIENKGSVFTIYTVTGSGQYDDYNNKSGKVTTEVVINSDNIIISTKFTLYEHTAGNFKIPSDKFIQSLVIRKTNILEFTKEYPVDGESGVSNGGDTSNSVKIIMESIFGLTQFLKGGN